MITFFSGTLFLIAAMTAAWELTRRTQNGGLADVIWVFALGAVAIFFSLSAAGDATPPDLRQWIAASIMLIWTVRLGLSLARRNIGGSEDARYADLRRQWGRHFISRLFGLLMIQAAAALLLDAVIMLAAHNPLPPGIGDIIAALWMLGSLAGSLISDNQLARFKKDPAHRGKICDSGLWSRTRHPNYFFETSFWAGWVPMAVSGGWAYGLLALAAPAFIYWLLRYVSGEPMVEKLMRDHYGEAFLDYCRRVPPFFPRLFKH